MEKGYKIIQAKLILRNCVNFVNIIQTGNYYEKSKNSHFICFAFACRCDVFFLPESKAVP